MSGRREPQATMLLFVDLEERVPEAHPIRTIRAIVDEAPGASLTGVRPDVLGGWPNIGAS